jgi:hypothetical protein
MPARRHWFGKGGTTASKPCSYEELLRKNDLFSLLVSGFDPLNSDLYCLAWQTELAVIWIPPDGHDLVEKQKRRPKRGASSELD